MRWISCAEDAGAGGGGAPGEAAGAWAGAGAIAAARTIADAGSARRLRANRVKGLLIQPSQDTALWRQSPRTVQPLFQKRFSRTRSFHVARINIPSTTA